MILTDDQRDVIEKWMRLAGYWARETKKKYPFEPIDDLVQDASVGLCSAAISFDPTKGTKFSTFASMAIQREIQKGIDRRKPKGNRYNGQPDKTASLDSMPFTLGQLSDPSPISSPEERTIHADLLRSVFDACRNDKDAEVIRLLAAEMTEDEVGEITGVSHQAVSQRRHRILGRMETAS